MVNEDIRGGLKSALERGQSLRSSMLSFLNAGYNKSEIEEAARTLTESVEQKVVPEYPTPAPMANYTAPSNNDSISKIFKKLIPEEKKQNSIKSISDYNEKEPKDKSKIILIISILVFVLGTLLLLFVFRQNLINFFSNLFG